jgi:hypothetical protein
MAIMPGSQAIYTWNEIWFCRCYESSKDRYVFNVPQLHSAVTRNAERVQWERWWCWPKQEHLLLETQWTAD